MSNDEVRKYCLSLPHATEDIQWEHDLLFRIGGKMFTVVCLNPETPSLSFKCTPEEFATLTEREGIIPAPYVARYHWVSVREEGALPAKEIKRLVRDSYQMVLAKLPRKLRDEFSKRKK